MARVICTLPNASEEINGFAFEKTDKGMLSEEISDEQAARFASINGYRLAHDAAEPVEPAPQAAAAGAETGPDVGHDAGAGAEDGHADGEKQDGATAAAPSADDIVALTEQAVALGIKVDARWKAHRLNAEIEKAQAAAAGAE